MSYASFVHPHDSHHYFAADREAETDDFNFERRGRVFAPILMQFEAKGVLYPWAPYGQLLAPMMNYFLLGR